MKLSDDVAARAVFLRKIHDIRCNDETHIYFMDNFGEGEGVKSESHQNKMPYFMSCSFNCHSIYSKSKLIFHFQSKARIDCHGDIHSGDFKMWLTKLFATSSSRVSICFGAEDV